MSTRRAAFAALTAAALTAAGLLAVTGCAAQTTPAAASAVPVSPASQAAPAAVTVPASLRFTGKTLDGTAFDAASLAGKPTLLWFWAPWCATCANQASSITDLHDKYGDRLGILGVAGLGDNKAMHQFVSDLDVGSVTNLDDQAGAVWRRFHVVQQSVFVLIDRQGAVQHTGWLDDVDLSAQVTALVG